MTSPKRAKNYMTNCKRRGEWAELMFMAKASKEGYRVFRPWGDSARYDVVVETRGRFLRVQVKSTTCQRFQGSQRFYVCNARPSTSRKVYRRGEFDFLAIYVIPEDLWYILPAKLIVGGKRSSVHIFTDSPQSRYLPYKEAWDLLRNHRRRTAPPPDPDQEEITSPSPDATA
jgi:hypothetical protein